MVTEVNRNVAATLKACGPAILAENDLLDRVVSIIATIITRSHPCQQDLGDEAEEVEVEGSSEYDWLVVDTALDVAIGLAASMGPAFGSVWQVFAKPILKFASSNENMERSTAVGVIAECAANMGESVSPYTGSLLPILLKRLSDTDTETKSNAAYAVGQLIINSNDAATYLPSYDAILEKLGRMVQVQGSRIRDNAAGCLSRMIMAHPERVNLGDVLPALVGLLPLKEDYEENAPVFECIYKLCKFFLFIVCVVKTPFRPLLARVCTTPSPELTANFCLLSDDSNEPTVQQLTYQLIPIFEQVLGPPEEQLEKESRQLLHQIVRNLHKAQPDLFQGHQAALQYAGVA